MYKIEHSTIEYITGYHVQFEDEHVKVGDILYINKDLNLVIESVSNPSPKVVIVTSGQEFIKLNKI